MSSAFWSDARAHMLLDPSTINLNTGSFGPLPRVVFERVTTLRRRLAEEPMDFPVFASGFSPLDSKGRLDGVRHGEPIRIGACVVRPGDWVFGDMDGVVIVPMEVAETAFARALEKVTGENRVREELARGRSLREVFAEYRIL